MFFKLVCIVLFYGNLILLTDSSHLPSLPPFPQEPLRHRHLWLLLPGLPLQLPRPPRHGQD